MTGVARRPPGPRRPGAATAALALAAAAWLACGGGGPEKRPNVVLIVTDDQPFSSWQYMPELQRHIVSQGVLFENFLVNDPICCPSRVTFLLGRYRHNHLLESAPRGCAMRFFLDRKHQRSAGALISEAGYRTGILGKYLNSYDAYLEQFGDQPHPDGETGLRLGWEDYQVLLSRRYYNFALHDGGRRRVFRTLAHQENYQTDVLSELVRDFVWKSAVDPRPFFLYVAPDAPHPPILPARRHGVRFQHLRAPRPPSFDEEDVSDKPSVASLPRFGPAQVAAIDERYRSVARGLQAVDELIGTLFEALEELGLADSTYVFYTSDNGFHFGEHRLVEGKGTPFEESVRVGLAVRGPGVARGEVRRQLTANVDVMPTLLELVGGHMDPAHPVDGRSLVPLLAPGASDLPGRAAFLLESTHELRNEGVPAFRALRSERYKWIEYASGARELYDLENDPNELVNLDAQTSAETKAALAERLGELLACAGDECVEVEDRPLPPAAR